MEGTTGGVLLAHDGELADVRAILTSFEEPFTERIGGLTAHDQTIPWQLVTGSARRVLEMQVGAKGIKPTRIAVLEGDSRTLLTMLRRSGVDLMVRRPVDPTALRLLLLRAMYQGPEKRRLARVTIGAPVRYRVGFRRRSAILADLSLRGCRLISPHAATRGQKLKLQLPTALGCDKARTLTGHVVRSGPTAGIGLDLHGIAVAFDSVTAADSASLKQILRCHLQGPAVLEGGNDSPAVPRPKEQELSAPETASPGTEERREVPRREIDRHMIALGVEATRVLVGRDISLGGMRVEPNESIALGDCLQIAIHVRARQEPIVVSAVVDRDDGEHGFALTFCDLSDAARTYLNKMVNFLPILAARGGDEGSGVIVSEILERTAAPHDTA